MPQLPRMQSYTLAFLLVMVALRYFGLITGLVLNWMDSYNSFWNPPVRTDSIVVIGFLALLGGTVVGLFRRRIWGVYCAYLLVPVSTVLHSIPLVPFISDLLPTEGARIIALPIINVAFLVGVVALHRSYRKDPPGTARLE